MVFWDTAELIILMRVPVESNTESQRAADEVLRQRSFSSLSSRIHAITSKVKNATVTNAAAMIEASAERVVSYMDRRYIAFAVASLQSSFAPRQI